MAAVTDALGAEGRNLIAAVRAGLAAQADPATAVQQQRYLKSTMPHRGLTAPRLRALLRPLLATQVLTGRAQWEATIRVLWDEATFREERYAATAIAGHRRYRDFTGPDTLGLYDHLITTGAWWDHVDAVAIQLVGPVQRAYRPALDEQIRAWAGDDDLWRRRAAIIHQVGAKAETDPALLTDCLLPNLTDREFFVRKAIGWALRQYAREQPDWVRAFVARHAEMSALSRREATKHLAGDR